MSNVLIDHNEDLLKLVNEGYEVSIVDNILVVSHVPYLNSQKEICYGKLIDPLRLTSPTKISKPSNHVIYFDGEHPCDITGKSITSIKHQTLENRVHSQNVKSNHSFSNKPASGYPDYYSKFSRYIEIISSYPKVLDPTVTEKTFKVIDSLGDNDTFEYGDTNSTRAGIVQISSKLSKLKVAIIGLGGTGSYILDFISKTSVSEIHLFDGDQLFQHNAFRCPGAIKKEDLERRMYKTDYLEEHYSKIRKRIVSHPVFVNSDNIEELKGFDTVFLAIDGGTSKDLIVNYLFENNIWFIDAGIGLELVDESIDGMVKVVSSGERSNEDLKKRIVSSTDNDNVYKTNIQIVELNAMAATIAVIKWKQRLGFYKETYSNDTFVFTMEWGSMSSERDEG